MPFKSSAKQITHWLVELGFSFRCKLDAFGAIDLGLPSAWLSFSAFSKGSGMVTSDGVFSSTVLLAAHSSFPDTRANNDEDISVRRNASSRLSFKTSAFCFCCYLMALARSSRLRVMRGERTDVLLALETELPRFNKLGVRLGGDSLPDRLSSDVAIPSPEASKCWLSILLDLHSISGRPSQALSKLTSSSRADACLCVVVVCIYAAPSLILPSSQPLLAPRKRAEDECGAKPQGISAAYCDSPCRLIQIPFPRQAYRREFVPVGRCSVPMSISGSVVSHVIYVSAAPMG